MHFPPFFLPGVIEARISVAASTGRLDLSNCGIFLCGQVLGFVLFENILFYQVTAYQIREELMKPTE